MWGGTGRGGNTGGEFSGGRLLQVCHVPNMGYIQEEGKWVIHTHEVILRGWAPSEWAMFLSRIAGISPTP